MFTDRINPITSNGVATIGREYIIPKGIGTVIWYWNDDEGQLTTNKLNNVLYFTESPVNILSETILTGFMNYDEGTWVPTKSRYSIFTWDFGKYKNTISH